MSAATHKGMELGDEDVVADIFCGWCVESMNVH
jgi:hypothetical protein